MLNETTKNGKPDSPEVEKTEERTEQEETLFTIFKNESHKNNRCLLNGIDVEKQLEFNLMKEITVTKQELETIGNHRWLGVKK